jgi:hypothetical protein
MAAGIEVYCMQHKAKEYFLGENGTRLNCAQAVLQAYCDTSRCSHKFLENHGDCGSGKAPGGYCGAFYAALNILELTGQDKRKECEDFFIGQAGALACKEIRRLKKLSCLGCVEKAAEFLMNTGLETKL